MKSRVSNRKYSKTKILVCILVYFFISLFIFSFEIAKSEKISTESDLNNNQYHEVILADFEQGIPSSHEGDSIGFRKKDKLRARIVEGGAEGSSKSGIFMVGPGNKDIYIQGDVRRKYLSTKSTEYIENGPNALSFWLYLSPDNYLINKVREIKVNNKVIAKKKSDKNTLGVWTYHWRYGDMGVGGENNTSLATDSMMHGYSNFAFKENAAGKWVNVVLSPSAFHTSRNYFHFYAARGTTDDLKFFASLRQLQFRVFSNLKENKDFQIDQIRLIYREPTAVFKKDFFEGKVSNDAGDFSIPVLIKNPTDKDRSYRVFISSFLGVEREVLNKAFSLTDMMKPMRKILHATNSDGGIGAVDLVSSKGKSIIKKEQEIFIPAGGVWEGKLVHHIKPEMLGREKAVKAGGFEFYVRRDTLTTSVIVWDPEDLTVKEMDYMEIKHDNSDDGKHPAPPGFPKQKRLPKGWKSKDIPRNQVGGYFVSVLHLED